MIRTISIVVPAYNEGRCVDELARRLRTVFERFSERYAFEAIVVENGSSDDTYARLLAIRAADPRFKIVQLQRNFDMEGGMCAGLAHASGDACVIMAADLQDPPELIAAFIAKWEEGYENVYQVVTRRADNSLFRRIAAQSFYWLIHALSETPVPRNASDFRLVDRRLYEAFNAMPERNRMVRAMWSWIGGKAIGIEHERPPRFGGVSTFDSVRTASFAVRGIFASSGLPLRLVPLAGAACLAGSAGTLGTAVLRRSGGRERERAAGGRRDAMLLGLFGLQFVLLGIVAEYAGMIFHEVRGRQAYLIRTTHGVAAVPDGRQRLPAEPVPSANGRTAGHPG